MTTEEQKPDAPAPDGRDTQIETLTQTVRVLKTTVCFKRYDGTGRTVHFAAADCNLLISLPS